MVETTEFPTSSTDGESTSGGSQGQTDDYKARFQGMQREYNKLKSEHDSLVTKLAAKDATIADAIQAKRDAEARAVSLSKDLETQLATVLAEKSEVDAKYNLLSAEQSKLTAKMEAETKRNEVRKVIAASKPALADWFDDGVLKPVNESGVYLEGDALQAYLDTFESRVLSVNTGAVANKLQGAKPPNIVVGDHSNSPDGMSMSDLATWLTKNPASSPDYKRYEKAYFQLVNNNNQK